MKYGQLWPQAKPNQVGITLGFPAGQFLPSSRDFSHVGDAQVPPSGQYHVRDVTVLWEAQGAGRPEANLPETQSIANFEGSM